MWAQSCRNSCPLTSSFQAAKFSFLGSNEELEMIFDWVDVERKGRLSLEEFNTGLSMCIRRSASGTSIPVCPAWSVPN